MVLKSVGSVQNSIEESHRALKTQGDRKEEEVKTLRKIISILLSGLQMDGPLKTQLQELEVRQSQASGEVNELEGRIMQ